MKKSMTYCVAFSLAFAIASKAEETPVPAAAKEAPAVAPVEAAKPADMPKRIQPQIPPPEDLVLEGKITMVEMTSRSKDGQTTKIPRYQITLADGTKVYIPTLRQKKDEAVIDMAPYVDEIVKIEGKGRTRMMKEKKYVSLITISKVEPVGAAAPAPVPAPPPAAPKETIQKAPAPAPEATKEKAEKAAVSVPETPKEAVKEPAKDAATPAPAEKK